MTTSTNPFREGGEALPQPSQTVNNIELVSIEDSKITGVSVYAGRAEVNRLFKVNAAMGQNQVTILGLPRGLNQWDSVRVEGRGAATIHDVAIATQSPLPKQTTSPALESLLTKEKKIAKSFSRAVKSLGYLETYMSSVKVADLDGSKLKGVIEEYETTGDEIDDRLIRFESELKEVKEEIAEERRRLAGPGGNEKLNIKATIAIFADAAGEIEISLIYVVDSSTWTPGYDIRVDMKSKERSTKITYKALITQNTGEDWNDVPLTLETSSVTFGVEIPALQPWKLSVQTAEAVQEKTMSLQTNTLVPSPPMACREAPRSNRAQQLYRSSLETEGSPQSTDMNTITRKAPPPPPPVKHRGMQVSSKGGVSATFTVPGLINIPGNGISHNVTIVQLTMDAEMNWICIPKKDPRVRLRASIKNTSEYTLLPGAASVYVDRSFISKTNVPLVSPGERFDCPLGLDPSIRVTYHPLTKKASTSGLYTKSVTHAFIQRITVHNTEFTGASESGLEAFDNPSIKIVDQVPISEDSNISVKLLQPALTVPIAGITVSASAVEKGGIVQAVTVPPVKVAEGVLAMWDSEANDAGHGLDQSEIESLGEEGRLCWACTVPPQSKVGLTLQWEVSAPASTDIVGLVQ